MASVRLIHIAPELPSTVGGVADYTAILSRRLVEVSDGTVEPVLMHAGNQPAEEIDVPFPVEDLSGKCSATALAQATERLAAEGDGRAVVLLEYSGYGYASRGVPLWLARGLRRVCGEDGVPLITMFHELYATGPPWTSAFWWSFLQKQVVKKIANLSLAVVTNRTDSARWLEEQEEQTDAPVRFQPVFSNVGEPQSESGSWDSYAVLFGGNGKEPLYQNHGHDIAAILRDMEVDRVVDLGPPPSEHVIEAIPIPVQIKEYVAAETISEYLQRASVGLLYRNPRALAKSGSLAAYMAHGVPPVVALRHSSQENETLERGKHYLALQGLLENGTLSSVEWQRIGSAGNKWYRENAHSRRAAETFLDLISTVWK